MSASSTSEQIHSSDEHLDESLAPQAPKKQKPRRKGRVSGASRAGIVFPIGRILRYSKELDPGHRHSYKSAVYMASVLEYLIAELIESILGYSKKTKGRHIKPKHIRRAIEMDPELKTLLRDVVFPEGGVVPHINAYLLPKETHRPVEKPVEVDATATTPSPHEQIDNN